MKHVCIKPHCDNSYESEDIDAYYCESCQEENKELAKKIDAQVASRPSKRVKNEYELAKEQGRIKTEPNGTEVIMLRG